MSESNSSRRISWHYVLLWLIVLASVGANIFLLVSLNNARQRTQQELIKVADSLDSIVLESFDLPIQISESLPISMSVPFSDTFQVPISSSIPVETTILVSDTIQVPINDVVSINRDVTVSVIILGQAIPVDIPIRFDLPVFMNVEVPVDLEVPVSTEVPVDMMVDVPISTMVPIESDVPVELSFPVTIPLDQMGLNELLVQFKQGLIDLAASLE